MKITLPMASGGEYQVNPSKIVALGLNYLEHIKESQSVDVQNFTDEIPAELPLSRRTSPSKRAISLSPVRQTVSARL